MRLEVGDVVKFFDECGATHILKVLKIHRDCTCSHYIDRINYRENPLPIHMHLTCEHIESGSVGYYPYIDQETLKDITSGDYFVKLKNEEPVQTTLF